MIRGTATLIASWNVARTGPQPLEKRVVRPSHTALTQFANCICPSRSDGGIVVIHQFNYLRYNTNRYVIVFG